MTLSNRLLAQRFKNSTGDWKGSSVDNIPDLIRFKRGHVTGFSGATKTTSNQAIPVTTRDEHILDQVSYMSRIQGSPWLQVFSVRYFYDFAQSSIPELKSYWTGHGFCGSPCIDELFSHSVSNSPVLCPECRSRLQRGDAHPIYLELPTCQDEQAEPIKKLVYGLGRIDESSKAISVEIAEKKLKKLTKTLDSDETNMVSLRTASSLCP